MASGAGEILGGQRIVRGFLFADLRGYTAFVEARGDAAAAELLDAYRIVIRDVVRRYGGAEIKTEGDSFYVVFPGASDAVRCGLAIVVSASVATDKDPARPIRVGIGIHAGESTETSDGYVGSAVNIAARLCAQAAAGEVLVSDTVRGLIRTSADVTFSSRGRRRLKGIAEPMAVYAATSSPTSSSQPAGRGARSATLRRRPTIVAAAIGGVVVIGAGWALLGAGATDPQHSPSPAPTTVAIASVSAAATPTPMPPPSPTLGSFPDVAEMAFLRWLPKALADVCTRGPYDYVYGGDAQTVLASLTCRPPLASGANEVVLRQFKATGVDAGGNDFTTDSALAAWENEIGLHPGDCATSPRAAGRWELFGKDAGAIACFVDQPTGDAVLWWSYEDAAILAKATNLSGDSAALYSYFSRVSPFIGP